jgi:splicing factor 45
LSQKPKPKTAFPKPVVSGSTSQGTPSAITSNTAKPAAKSTLADWTKADDDLNGFYEGEKRQRGGRKKRKKNNREEHMAIQDWDDIYDPTRPNNYEEYKHSDEKIREVREWKDRLYAHRIARKSQSGEDSDEDDYRPRMNSKDPSPPVLSYVNRSR